MRRLSAFKPGITCLEFIILAKGILILVFRRISDTYFDVVYAGRNRKHRISAVPLTSINRSYRLACRYSHVLISDIARAECIFIVPVVGSQELDIITFQGFALVDENSRIGKALCKYIWIAFRAAASTIMVVTENIQGRHFLCAVVIGLALSRGPFESHSLVLQIRLRVVDRDFFGFGIEDDAVGAGFRDGPDGAFGIGHVWAGLPNLVGDTPT